MDVKQIEREIERVEIVIDKNSSLIDVTGAMARGVWELALQLAIANDRNEDAEYYRDAVKHGHLEARR